LEDGAQRWSVDLAARLVAPKGFFGRCGAPLVEGQLVLLNAGGKIDGRPAGVVAFDRDDGTLAWSATGHEASYSSPVAVELGGVKTAVFLTRDGLLGIDPGRGEIRFDVPYRPQIEASVNAASPVPCGPGRLFVSTCYGVGGSVWELESAADGIRPKKLWAREGALDCHYATPVYASGYLYGAHGRQEQGMDLRCIEAATGEVKWSTGEVGGGQTVLAGDSLVLLTEDGELVLADADPAGFRLRARDQVLGRGTRGEPAVAGGFVYAKGPRQLVCIDAREKRTD
jgi:outer membrane protein assembly factor BamB